MSIDAESKKFFLLHARSTTSDEWSLQHRTGVEYLREGVS